MAGSAQRICFDSPVFTREDEERYHYVDTEVDSLTSSRTDEEAELDAVSANRDQQRPGILKVTDQPHQHDRNSMMRDSLEDDFDNCDDSNAAGRNKNGIVVADPSRYEDLMIGARGQRAVQNQSKGNVVVPRRVVADAEPSHYYLHDDAEEYEEAALERQHQRRQARRAHVPHLELRHSDDEPSDGEAAFDLELNDGRVPRGNKSKKKVDGRRVNFGALPHSSNSADGNKLFDSLEVAEYYPDNGGDDANTDYEERLYTNNRACGKNQPLDQKNSANSYLCGYGSTQTGQHGQRRDLPETGGSNQAHALTPYSSDNRHQLSNHPALPPSQVQVRRYASESQSHGQSSQTSSSNKRRSDESSATTDFVEANRHNVNRKQQRSYGQIHSRKKGRENNTADSERSHQLRPADAASLAPVADRQKSDPVSEQNPLAPGTESEETSTPSAEQLWQSRSRSLAARKESAESQPGKNRSGKGSVRDARSHPAAPPQTTSSSAPLQHHPNVQQQQQQQLSTGSFNVPVQSQVPTGNSPPKVSVDINLNVVSPRPLLNQPSTSLQLQYANSSSHQYPSRTQTYANAPGHYQYPATAQPPISNGVPQSFAMFPQATADNGLQYTSGIASLPSYTMLPHSHFAPQTVSGAFQQPMPHFVDAQGQSVTNQQHLPIRYNYSHPQQLAVAVGDAPQHDVHPYQTQVCSVEFLAVGKFGLVELNNLIPLAYAECRMHWGSKDWHIFVKSSLNPEWQKQVVASTTHSCQIPISTDDNFWIRN